MTEAIAFVAFAAVMGFIAYSDHKERMAIIAAYREIIAAASKDREVPD